MKKHAKAIVILSILFVSISWALIERPHFKVAYNTSWAAEDALPVFPGAQGFGTTTRAAYGGSVPPVILRVTNLNDSGAGSLRAALSDTRPRVIIFEISGTINLNSDIQVTSPYLTVAGATAPSPGISVRNYQISIRTHDVFVQHIRSRVGTMANATGKAQDGINIQSYNVVLDHVSVAWSVDGSIDFANGARNSTVSNCLVVEPLQNSGGSVEQNHSRPFLLYDNSVNVAILRCATVHTGTRLPVFQGGTRGVAVNNLIYDQYESIGTSLNDPNGAGAPIYASIVGNRYIQGPSPALLGINSLDVIRVRASVVLGSKLYKADNTFVGSKYRDYRTDTTWGDPAAGVTAPPVQAPLTGITVLPSADVQAHIVANAGARPADRDSVDKAAIEDIVKGTGQYVSSPSQGSAGGFPSLPENIRPLTVPPNPHMVTQSGYTNLEIWLHGYAAQVEGAPAMPTLDTVPPTVIIASPASGSTLSGNAVIQVNASDNVGVAGVTFKLDGSNLFDDLAAPYSVNLDTTSITNGTHAITATARDLAGNIASVTVSFKVDNLILVASYQAENSAYGGGSRFEDYNVGFNGNGYVNFPMSDGYVEFRNVDGKTGGNMMLKVRHALGLTHSETGRMQVNGEAWQDITFVPTGNWTTWNLKEIPVSLTSGTTNTIRFESTGQDMANIDQLEVSGMAASTAKISLTPTVLSFQGVSGEASPSPKSVTVGNVGTASLNFNAKTNQDWCHVSPVSGSVAPGAVVNLSITMDQPSNVGSFTCKIDVWGDASNSPQTVTATYTVTAPLDTTQPAVSITSPVDGTAVSRKSKVAIQAAATDNVGVARVEFRVDNALICTDTAAPYSCVWTVPNSARSSSYALTAKAYDQAGNSAVSGITLQRN